MSFVEFIKIFTPWLFAIGSFIFTLIIKFNHLKHLSNEFADLKKDIKESNDKNSKRHDEFFTSINEIKISIGKIETKCEDNCGKS